MAEEEVHRLNELVRELVDFSNPNKYQTERIDLRVILDRALQLVKGDLEKKKIACKTEFENNLPDIFVNKNQIMEMFLNLIINAIDAMDDNGTLSLKAEKYDTDMAKAVKIEISDTGCGIDDKDLAAIFDRYYTKKETGTGLGLAVVERIVSAHGGKIEVKSKKGVGTNFSIYLPR
jgi:signal transduction histidine kinase